jgi:hypothetical protein
MDMPSNWPILPLDMGGGEAAWTTLWKAGLEWQAKTAMIDVIKKDENQEIHPLPADEPK